MWLLLFIILFFFMWVYLILFKKKLMVLLSLEGMMLVAICMVQLNFLLNTSSFFILIVLSVFMVLDSVFGVSMLIVQTRFSLLSAKTII